MRGLNRLEDVLLRHLLAALRDELVLRHGPSFHSLLLFGSRARGDARPDSDIDLLLVVDAPPHADGLAGVRDAFELRPEWHAWTAERGMPLLAPVVSTSVEAAKSRYLYLDLIDQAVVVYDRDDFMRRKLDRLRNRLHQLGAHRVFFSDASYLWRLAPDFRLGDTVEL